MGYNRHGTPNHHWEGVEWGKCVWEKGVQMVQLNLELGTRTLEGPVVGIEPKNLWACLLQSNGVVSQITW